MTPELPRSMTEPEGVPRLRRLDRSRSRSWEDRFALVFRVLPYLLAVGACALGAVSGLPPVRLLWSGILAAVTLALVCWFETLHPEWEHDRPGRTTGYLFTRLAITAVLVVVNPWWGLFAWLGYTDFFRMSLIGGRLTTFVGLGITATLMAGTEIGGFWNLPELLGAYLVMVVLNLLLAGTMGGSFAFVAIRNEQRRVALVELAEANRKLSETLRENAGLHAQLLTQAREAGIRDEQARLAREIHDTIAQGLAGIITQLQAAQRVPDSAEYVRTALGLARDSLGEARRSVQALRPVQLEDATLPAALERIVDQWAAREELTATLVTTGTARPLHPEIEATLVRVAQEALTNAARHARAGRVGVTLSYMEDVVSLDVRDDGVGFDPAVLPADGAAPVPAGGFGLVAMRQRIARLAGELTVESEPGGGTAISATVPAVTAA